MPTSRIVAAWDEVRAGEPRIVRLVGAGGPAEAAAFVAAHRAYFVESWSVDGVPQGDEPRIAWFGEGLAQAVAADIVVGAVALLQVPWLVLLTGPDAADRGPDLGEVIEVPGGSREVERSTNEARAPVPSGRREAEGAGVAPAQGDEGSEAGEAGEPLPARPTRVDHPLADPPADPEVIEVHLERAATDGRASEAAAWYRALRRVAPARAISHRYLLPARCRALVRPDTVAVARAVFDDGPEGRSRMLSAVAAAVDRRAADRLREAAVATAADPRELADARFGRDRERMARGELTPRELTWPASAVLAAQHLYYLLEKAERGSAERQALAEQLEAIDSAFGRVLLQIAEGTVDGHDIGYWLRCVRGHVALGQLRNAAFELSGKVLAAPPEQRARLERGVGLIPMSFSELPALDNAIAAGDWARARAIARRVGGLTDTPFMLVIADVVELACRAVLDGDASGFVGLDREDLREYMQPGFPELLESAVAAAPETVKPRLLYQVATWWAALGATEQHAATLVALRELRPARLPLGDYVLDEPIASGGMGEVWRGRHARFGEPVAVKFLKARETAHLDAFLQEVELTARLDHEAIVQVHDVGRVSAETDAASQGRLRQGTPYLVMEYVPDGTLATPTAPLSPDELQAVLLAVLDALAYAHARDVVHRDLKPANVLVHRLPDGLRIRLSDFGLAGMPMAGVVSGTPQYMAPEQFSGVGVGPWSDLYAVGCLATALVTGSPLFRGNARDLGLAHRFEDPEPLPGGLGLPDGFDAWRLRLLAKDPSDRYPHARAAFLALEALGTGAIPLTWAAAAPLAADTFDFQTLVGLAPTSVATIPRPPAAAIPAPGERPPPPARASSGSVPSAGSGSSAGSMSSAGPDSSGRAFSSAGGLGGDLVGFEEPGVATTAVAATLPDSGFSPRTVRPRLPTVHLFSLRELPRLGHREARQQLWELARDALSTGAVHEVGLEVASGVAWEPVVSWLVLRLREHGVDARREEGGHLAVLVDLGASRGPALVLRRVVAGREVDPSRPVVRLGRLGQPELVAWVRAQVGVEDDLAWEIARRSHGAPDLARSIVAELLERPGLVAGAHGLTLAGALPRICAAEHAFWRTVVQQLPAERVRVVGWAAVLVPGFTLERLSQLCRRPISPGSLDGLARQVAGRWTLAVGLRAVVRDELRRTEQLAARHREVAALIESEGAHEQDRARLGIHLLEAGAEGAEEVLLEALHRRLALHDPPDRDLLEALAICLDLRLTSADDARRGWLELGWGLRALGLGRLGQACAIFERLAARGGRSRGQQGREAGWEEVAAHAAWRRLQVVGLRDPHQALASLDAVERSATGEVAGHLVLDRAVLLARAGAADAAWACLEQAFAPAGEAPGDAAAGEAPGDAAAGEVAEPPVPAKVVGGSPSAELVARGSTIRAGWLVQQREHEEAVAVLRELLDADLPPSLRALVLVELADALLAGDRVEEAAAVAREAVGAASGPVRVRALRAVAWSSLLALDQETAVEAARDGLGFLLGTAWEGPRAFLEAILLAARVEEASEEWELLWEARGRSTEPDIGEVLLLGASRGLLAGRRVRARWLAQEALRVLDGSSHPRAAEARELARELGARLP